MGATLPFDEDWFRRCGRLEEPDEGGERLLTGRLGRMSPAQYATPVYRSSRPLGPAGGNSFHLSHTILRRTRRGPPPRVPSDADAPPGRSFIFPGKAMSRAEAAERQRRLARPGSERQLPSGMVGQLKAIGGVYDRARRCWHVPSEMVAKRVVPATWRGGDAASAWLARRLGGPDGSPGAAARFQAYVERAAESESRRRAHIESDGSGEISFGTIGTSSEERIGYWRAGEERERPGGRVQLRIVAELPHWLDSGDRRRIAIGFCSVFERLGLPYHAVVHLPDVDEGGDERNIHLHVLYSDRPLVPASAPVAMSGPAAPVFAKRKRAEVSHIGWPRSLRRHFARVVNHAIAEGALAGKPPPEGRGFYDPRTYREMGIEKLPAQHMGPWRMRLERAGVPTLRGVRNGWKEGAWCVVAAADADLAEARGVERVFARHSDGLSAYPRSQVLVWLGGAAADALGGAQPVPLDIVREDVRADFERGRAGCRRAWAERELMQLREGNPRPGTVSQARSSRNSPRKAQLEGIRNEAAEVERSLDSRRPIRSAEAADQRRRTTAAWSHVVGQAIGVKRMRECVDEAVAAAGHVARERTRGPVLDADQPMSAMHVIEIAQWQRRLGCMRQVAGSARQTLIVAIRRLEEEERAAEGVMGTPRGSVRLAEGGTATALDLLESAVRDRLAATELMREPALTWLRGEWPRLSREAGGASERAGEPEIRNATPLHPFARRSARERDLFAKQPPRPIDRAHAALERQRAVCVDAILRWISARTVLERELRKGPLPSLWLPDVERAWRARQAQLLSEATGIGETMLQARGPQEIPPALATIERKARDFARQGLELVAKAMRRLQDEPMGRTKRHSAPEGPAAQGSETKLRQGAPAGSVAGTLRLRQPTTPIPSRSANVASRRPDEPVRPPVPETRTLGVAAGPGPRPDANRPTEPPPERGKRSQPLKAQPRGPGAARPSKPRDDRGR